MGIATYRKSSRIAGTPKVLAVDGAVQEQRVHRAIGPRTLQIGILWASVNRRQQEGEKSHENSGNNEKVASMLWFRDGDRYCSKDHVGPLLSKLAENSAQTYPE